MKDNRLLLVLAISFFASVIVLAWLFTRLVIPINPVKPYFPDNDKGRISLIYWIIGKYQPVYLYSFENNGDLYIKAAHRDLKNKIELMDIYLGNKNNTQIRLTPFVSQSTKAIQTTGIGDYQKRLKFGDRFLVSYIRSASPKEDAILKKLTNEAAMTDKAVQDACLVKPELCDVAKYTIAESDKFWNFRNTGIFDTKTKFPALSLSLEIIK